MKLLFFLLGVSVALTSVPACSQTRALVSTDTLQLPASTPPRYDFYYSAHQAEAFMKISIASYALADRLTRKRFRDKTYTTFVAKGLPIQDGFDDYVLIGSGTIDEIKPDGYW